MRDSQTPNWNKLPTPLLLEEAGNLTKDDQDSQAARCICALVWRLRSSEEWIASLQARCPQGAR